MSKDYSGTSINRFRFIKQLSIKSRTGSYYWIAICPKCHQECKVIPAQTKWQKSCGCYTKQIQRESGYRMVKNLVSTNDKSHVNGTHALILNSTPKSDNTSGVRGVTWCKVHRKWKAYITFKSKTYFLGYFSDINEASRIRKKAEQEKWGDFLTWYNNIYKKEK